MRSTQTGADTHRQAARLVDSCREVDTISRLGGDEFIVLMENLGKEQDAVKISRKIIDALSRPFSFKGEDIFVTSSIGISLYPADTDTVEGLMKNADLAMYHAKDLLQRQLSPWHMI